MKHFDAIIIGAGQAGTPLAKKLAMAGKKTCIIEKRYIGGTCINDGCTPTKAMIASAKAAYQPIKAAALGVEIGKVKVNFKKIKERKDKIVDEFRTSSQKGLEETKGLTILMGEASFTGERELSVKDSNGNTQQISGNWIFINTGAKTAIPEIEGLNDIDYLTSTTILDLEEVPKH